MFVKKYHISKYQGNYDRQRNSVKELFVFRIYNNISWTGKVTMTARVKYVPQHIYFDEDSMYDTNKLYGPSKGFDYSRITVGKELEAELDHTEKKSVGNIGVSRN